MDLSNFVTYDKKEYLLLNIAKSNQEIVENTHSKPQETLEFKMTKQKESFSFDVPLQLNENWMMGVTSLEVYNTVYNITNSNNKLKILLTDEQLIEHGVDIVLVKNIKSLYESYNLENQEAYNEFVEKVSTIITNSYSENNKLAKKDFNDLKELVEANNQQHTKHPITIPEFEIQDDSIEIELPPGVYELVDINNAIKQKIHESDYDFKIDIIPDTISMKSVLTTSNSIHFNSRLNILLGFTNKDYPPGTHTSEKPVMITTTDKVHLKCDCVDGSIVNGIREQILFSFNLSAPPGYKIINNPTTVLYKKINKTRLDQIQFFLEDSNHNPVDFNNETLTFTIQIIKI